MGSNSRGQVTTCRETHDAHILRVDVPLLGMATYQADSLFSILGRNLPDAMGHAILQHDESNTLTVEERRPLVSFMIHSQSCIATTRTTYYGTSRSLLLVRQIDPYLSHILRITITGVRTVRPQINL